MQFQKNENNELVFSRFRLPRLQHKVFEKNHN